MLAKVSKLILLLTFTFIGGGIIFAQDREFPEGLRETLAKRRIQEEEKEHQELIKRGEEAVKLSEEISKSYEENQKFSAEDQKKLEKLEKVVKRIRRDLGAEEDNEKTEQNEKPSTMFKTLESIREKTSNLLTELKKASRHSISVVAVESSNTIFRLIRFLRINKN